MGLFKGNKSKKSNYEDSLGTSGSHISADNSGKKNNKKKFSVFGRKSNNNSKNNNNGKKVKDGKSVVGTDSPGNRTTPTVDSQHQRNQYLQSQLQQQRNDPVDIDALNGDDEDYEEYDLGDIPKSISTHSQQHDDHLIHNAMLLPSGSNHANNEGRYEDRGEVEDGDVDSLDSPCSITRKNSRSNSELSGRVTNQVDNMANNTANDTARSNNNDDAAAQSDQYDVDTSPPSLAYLPHYIAALSPHSSHSPSSELPSRALRSLFTLSEHASSQKERIAMVRDPNSTSGGRNGDGESPGPLVPALLSFLQRCAKDSSEQYLTMLVLNNVSIPLENKRLIAIECGGAKTLARLLCEDPGCHLLVIIIVNLTFCEVEVRRDLLTSTITSVRKVQRSNSGSSGGKKGGLVGRYLSSGGDVQLVDALAYALLVSSFR